MLQSRNYSLPILTNAWIGPHHRVTSAPFHDPGRHAIVRSGDS